MRRKTRPGSKSSAQGGSPERRGGDFWAFSIAVYDSEDIRHTLLDLQDREGADVNLLLVALWCAANGRRMSTDAFRELDELIAGWRERVILPLRTMRVLLRGETLGLDAAGVEAFRTQLKVLELEAERLEQQRLSQSVADGLDDLSDEDEIELAKRNLVAYAHAFGCSFTQREIDTLASSSGSGAR